MRKFLELGVFIMAAAGFFGFIYPELCLIEDTVRVTIEEAVKDESEEEGLSHKDLLEEICNLPPEKIRIKSRFAEYFSETKKKNKE